MQRPRLGGMGWPRDRCDPAGLCHARIRQPSRSLPGRRKLISIQAAPYAREKRGPLQDAERFLEQLRERLRKFGLELHPDKTRLIEFGRYAAEQRKKRGAGKPETFNFLGFTHICGRSRPKGYFTVYRKTMGKRMAAKLKVIQRQLQGRMHEAIGDTVKWLQAVL